MAKLYRIAGDKLIDEIDTAVTDVVALPLLAGKENASLLNEKHARNLMGRFDLTAAQALDALGLTDARQIAEDGQ